MSETKQISEQEAIRQVISESSAFDYADIVNAVHKRFRLEVNAAQVEEIYHEMKSETQPAQTQVPQPRTTVSMTVNAPEAKPAESPEIAPAVGAAASASTSSAPKDDMDHALQFVKSVGGLAKAKRALLDLESALLGSD